jgi:hypothetical protein
MLWHYLCFGIKRFGIKCCGIINALALLMLWHYLCFGVISGLAYIILWHNLWGCTHYSFIIGCSKLERLTLENLFWTDMYRQIIKYQIYDFVSWFIQDR